VGHIVVIVTQICHSGQPSHGGDRNFFKVMISPLSTGTLFSVASVLTVSSITEILIGATRSRISLHYARYILHMHVLLEWCYTSMESSQWENWYHLFCLKVFCLTAPHCRFLGVSLDMNQTYLFLWYLLFHSQWDICDQQNYLVKGHHLHSGTWNYSFT
jgi:hypothetical protein